MFLVLFRTAGNFVLTLSQVIAFYSVKKRKRQRVTNREPERES